MDEFRFGIRHRLFNFNLKQRREELGMTLEELSQKIGRSKGYISNLQAFKVFPTEEMILKIAIALEVPPEALFPEAIEHFRIDGKAQPISISMSEARKLGMVNQALLVSPDIADEFKNVGLKEQIEKVLKKLKPREQRVLRLRFGLDDGRSRTLEEVGKELGVTRERIRGIEAKSLRQLRHPRNSRKLKDYLW